MAASSYYLNEHLHSEEYLDSKAHEIDNEIRNLQARIRGFIHRTSTGFASHVAGHSPISQGHEKIPDIDCKAKIADHDKKTIPNEDADDTSKTVKDNLDDPDFAEKKVDDLPNGWLVAWTPDGTPFFVETGTSTTTWTHPRQSDSNLLFGKNFNLAYAWNQYSESFASRSNTPTIGELALYCCAMQGYEDPVHGPGWWRDSKPSHPNEGLCDVCSHINFDALFHTTDAWGETTTIPLGSLRSIAKRTYCAFCRLVTKTIPPSWENLLEFDTKKTVVRCEIINDMKWAELGQRIRTINIRLGIRHRGHYHHIFGRGTIHQLLKGAERPPEQKFNDARLVKDQIDVALVKSWMQHCEQQHQSLLSKPMTIDGPFEEIIDGPFERSVRTDDRDARKMVVMPCQPVSLTQRSSMLTLLDLEVGCLVDTKPDVRYVALSYVWGGPQPFQNTKSRGEALYTPGFVSEADPAIPATVRDSMRFVGMLGERYLWIDSLCIVQDSTSEKMEQIANMGNIYSRAVLTLVAAHGDSCHAGLPGVRPGSRQRAQYMETIDGMQLSSQSCNLNTAVELSIWGSRGWTYQERELSTRCLFFTQDCVYFSCSRITCMEDSGRRDVSRIGEKERKVRPYRQTAWNSYRSAVKEFTKRTFTFDSDVVNAFEGIATLLEPVFKCDFIYGIPETELDLALLWQSVSAIRRRIDQSTGDPLFPSWCWAGWVGEFDYLWTEHVLDDLSRLQWQVQSSDKEEYVTTDQLRAPQSGSHEIWEFVPSRRRAEPSHCYQPQHPNLWCLHPIAPKEDRLPRCLVIPGTHELRFKAKTAMLRIVVEPHVLADFGRFPVSPCTADEHVLCPVEILSVDGFLAGTLSVPIHIMGTLNSGIYEFVCLSRRRAGSHVKDLLYTKFQRYDDYPQLKDNLDEVPQKPTLYPGQATRWQSRDKYDQSRFNPNKLWPLYNVMLIERNGDLVFRVAIGTIHVTAFLQANPAEKLIILA